MLASDTFYVQYRHIEQLHTLKKFVFLQLIFDKMVA